MKAGRAQKARIQPCGRGRGHGRGAALLAAMLTVTLVASLAATALWQQWRSVAVESAERTRVQAAWVLAGALDWARLILVEDERTSTIDHLGEPWAVALQEARLSTFLAAQGGAATVEDATVDTTDAFLSGQITDMQSRLNLRNLLGDNRQAQAAQRQFARLFERLGLGAQELQTLIQALTQAQGGDAAAPLMPSSVDQLGWLGMSAESVARLAPHVVLLPVSTAVNANTASADVLWAAIDGLDAASAQRLVQLRQSRYFHSAEEVRQALGKDWQFGAVTPVTVSSQFFEVQGQLRLDGITVRERSLVQRRMQKTLVLWRRR